MQAIDQPYVGHYEFRRCDDPDCIGPLCRPSGVPHRQPKLYFTISCPRAGKSTLAGRWLRREASLIGEEDDRFPRYVWDSDLLRLEMTGKAYHRDVESMVFAVKKLAVATALRVPTDVCIAGTHSSDASIRRVLEIRRDAIPVFVETPLEICLERAVKTGQEYLLPVIPRVHEQVQRLKDEGIDRVIQRILSDIDERRPY